MRTRKSPRRAVLFLAAAALAGGGCVAQRRAVIGPQFTLARESRGNAQSAAALPPGGALFVAQATEPATDSTPEATTEATTEPAEPAEPAAEEPAAEEPAAPPPAPVDERLVYPTMDEKPQYFTGGMRTFSPLLADPRWPGILTTYRFQSNGRYLNEYEAVNIGGVVTLVRGPAEFFGTVFESEVGLMAGTFSVFDPGHMQDLVAIDYVGSLYGSIRRGRFSALARYWHLSAHAGDEFLLSDNYGGAGRNDLLLENFQALTSYDLDGGVRVYGGGTYRADVAPDEYGSFQLQYGAEWQPDVRYGDGRPFVAVDGQSLSGYGFAPSVSVRGGLNFNRGVRGPAFRLVTEFYVGRDPNGQLFDDRVLFTGLGLQFNF